MIQLLKIEIYQKLYKFYYYSTITLYNSSTIYLNQTPYDYTVEVTNRFKGLDLIHRMPEELWTEVHDIVQEAVIKTIPNKKKCKKEKWLSEEALQIAEKEEKQKTKEKRKDISI